MGLGKCYTRRGTTAGIRMTVCFDSLFQWLMYLLHYYHNLGFQNPYWIIKDAAMQIYNFWIAHPDHGPVCSSA